MTGLGQEAKFQSPALNLDSLHAHPAHRPPHFHSTVLSASLRTVKGTLLPELALTVANCECGIVQYGHNVEGCQPVSKVFQ